MGNIIFIINLMVQITYIKSDQLQNNPYPTNYPIIIYQSNIYDPNQLIGNFCKSSAIPSDLECFICNELNINILTSMNCGHSYCWPCIEQHINTKLNKNINIDCPKCRT